MDIVIYKSPELGLWHELSPFHLYYDLTTNCSKIICQLRAPTQGVEISISGKYRLLNKDQYSYHCTNNYIMGPIKEGSIQLAWVILAIANFRRFKKQ